MATTPQAPGWDTPEPDRPTPLPHDGDNHGPRQRPDTAGPTAGPASGPAPGPVSRPALRLVSAGHTPGPVPFGRCDSSSTPTQDIRVDQSRGHRRGTRSGAEIRGQVLLTLAAIRMATPEQLRRLLLPHQKGTDNIRRALRDLMAESPALTGRGQHGRQSIWHLTGEGLREAGAAGEGPDGRAKATGRGAAKTDLRKHALAVTDTAVAFHRAGAAHVWDFEVEVAHPAPGGQLVTDAVALLADAAVPYVFLEVDRYTTSRARLREKMNRYAAYQAIPPVGRTVGARKHWQHRYHGSDHGAFPPVLWVFTGTRGNPATREKSFHDQAQRLRSLWNRRVSVATTTLDRLQAHGPQGPVWWRVLRPARRVTLSDVPPGEH